MIKKISFLVGMILMFGFVSSFSNPVSSTYQSNPTMDNYYSSSDFSDFWPIMNDMAQGNCEAATDFAMMIPPGGCSPAVVRSDLLASQNVPVFCKLSAVQLNPLIKVSSIKSLSFSGEYPKEVAAVRFHPANAGFGLMSNTLLNKPVVNNIGYAVIILKKTPNESSLTNWVSGNLTAKLSYDAEQAFGLGDSEFYLNYVDDSNWQYEYLDNSFWLGKGFLRLKDVQSDKARISLYLGDKDNPYRELTLKEGETSDLIYLPGFYCMAGLRVRLNEVVSDDNRALLWVGEDKVWVREGTKILNGRCRVESIVVNSLSVGSVRLNCMGAEKIELTLSGAYKANFTIADGEPKSYDLGSKVIEGDSSNNAWHIAYITDKSKAKFGQNRISYTVLVSQKHNEELDPRKVENIKKAIAKVDRSDLSFNDEFIKGLASNSRLRNGTDFIVLREGASINVGDKSLTYNGIWNEDLSTKKVDSGLTPENKTAINEYYGKYDPSVKELIDYFPQTVSGADERYSEKALFEQIELTRVLVGNGIKTEADLNELREKFLELYPDSSYMGAVRLDLESSSVYDRSNSSVIVDINGEFYKIALDSLKTSDPSEKSVEVLVNGISKGRMNIYQEANLSAAGSSFKILEISKNRVKIEYKENRVGGPYTRMIDVTPENVVSASTENDVKFSIRNIDIKQVAHVSIMSEQSNAKTEANFTFKIGIEKRAFELTPEKTNKSLEKLNQTIAKWEKKLESFGKLIEGWKKVCFFTGIGLQAKNLITGFSGESLARQEVMKYYRDACDKELVDGKGDSVSRMECYNRKKSFIDDDIKAYKEAVDKSNEVLKKYKTLEEWKNSSDGRAVSIVVNGKTLTADDFNSWSEVKDYYLNGFFSEKGGSVGPGVGLKFNSTKSALEKRYDERVESDKLEKQAKEGLAGGYTGQAIIHSSTGASIYASTSGTRAKNIVNKPAELSEEAIVERISVRTDVYLVVLNPARGGTFKASNQVYKQNISGGWEKVPEDELKKGDRSLGMELSKFEFRDGGICKNNYTAPQVMFFGTEPNKGRPAIVPFDLENGWYVKVSQVGGGLTSSEVQGYQDSGSVRFFYICNVGANRMEENMGGDDICQSFDVNSYSSVSGFGGCSALSQSDVRRLGDDAIEAVRQAGKAYQKDIKKIRLSIRGKSFDVNVGSEYAAGSPIGECTDFMSVTDCNILFNVCDPVICPSSRCDFGGKVKVDNVIASGVAGSLLLCLPNFGSPSKGGVVIPVCLTGLHAGLDGWLSVLRAEYACKEEAMKTGRYVGLCDYVTSIYKCEFFWRNAQPLLKNVVPKIAEILLDPSSLFKEKRGGGEYLTFQTSWDNLDSSLNHFKNQYAGTSFLGAINYSNVEEFGSAMCRQFIGTSFPTKGEAFDAMFKPDSPTQFYAEFSEIPYSEATVPPTSQYKVLYHIFAGNDRAVSYQVYLKDPPSSPHYQNNPQVHIGSGAIANGKFASESKTFTAPQGYKQLCVILNGVEKCGFKQVTSDVGVEAITKSQVAVEAEKRDIKTEAQCISGSSSVIGMASSLNLESGAASSLTPEIYQMGLVRVCASENPGKGVSDNWVEVGYCGNENIKCWLDKDTVNRNTLGVLNNVNTVEEAVKTIGNKNSNSGLDEEGSAKLANYIEVELKNLGGENDKLKDNITTLKERGYFDYHQARGYYLNTLYYKILIENILRIRDTKNAIKSVLVADSSGGSSNGEVIQDDSDKLLASLDISNEISYGGNRYNVSNKNANKIEFYKIGVTGPSIVCDYTGTSKVSDCLGKQN